MKNCVISAIGILASVLLATSTMAADQASTKQEDPRKGKGGQAAVSKVPKAQQDTVKKRAEAKKQRDEKLKVRAQNINK